MTASTPMVSLRRRAMPGMPAAPSTTTSEPAEASTPSTAEQGAAAQTRPRRRATADAAATRREAAVRRHPVDYSATHLANFRLPVDLRARYAKLIAQAQERHPQLRKMSMTEVLIGLLAEGPQTPDEIAELIRRKRVAEHGAEGSR